MSVSDLDRLYTLLDAKTGIGRVRDVRLERIAADRALEMRYQQGTTYDPTNPIVHERAQLQARVYPWQTIDGVTENATWHYYPPSWADPIEAAVDAILPDGTQVGWWNSDVHRDQLLDTRWTHWGHGIHFEDVSSGARRWYFMTVFASDLPPLAPAVIYLQPGKYACHHLTADGTSIHRSFRNVTAVIETIIDDRMQVPGRGPMIHLTGKPLKTRWIADGPLVTWA